MILSNRVAAALLGGVFGSMIVASTARADVPACPASLGTYTATVQGNNVIVCPTTASVPGLGRSIACPYALGVVRRDVASGATQAFTGPCVADPQNDAGDAGTTCYLDSCVMPGTYEYGDSLPAFAACTNGGCVGQTSGEFAVVATVSSPVSGCTPSQSTPGIPAPWFDAGIVDGAVPWSGICHGPLPDPDGGYCAWNWAPDGSAEWAQCPPDGGSRCPGYENDGAVVPVVCADPPDGGPAPTADASSSEPDAGSISTAPEAGGASSTTSDGGAGATSGTTASPDAGSSTASNGGGQASNDTGGGCSAVNNGVGATPLGPLLALGLVFAIRAARRKRREREGA